MRTAIVAAVLGMIVGVGIYIGVSCLATQYALVPGGSQAGQYACTPDSPTHAIGGTVRFVAAIPEGTPYYWSAPDGIASFVTSGPLNVQYARPGQKTVRVFYMEKNRWVVSSCSVQIR